MQSAKTKPAPIFIGPYFYWKFRADWEKLNALAKSRRLRFDAELKRWRVPDAHTAESLLRGLLAMGEPEININVQDFETEELIPIATWKARLAANLDAERVGRQLESVALSGGQRKAALKVRPTYSIDGGEHALMVPLTAAGHPRAEYALLYGLARYGCDGVWTEGAGFKLASNTTEAADFVFANRAAWPELEIRGVPKMPESASIVHFYEGTASLFAHQKTGINFLYARRAAILADDMGLGKSAQSILAAEQLYLEKRADYLLILCPVTLVPNWRRELKIWESSFPFERIRIVPYSQMAKLKTVPPRTVLIADEAHYLKRADSQRTRGAMQFVGQNKANFVARWFLTGTPVTRDNGDLWSLAYLIDHPVSIQFAPMKLRAMKKDLDNAILSGAMKTHMLMRKKTDVLDLPPKIRQVVDVETTIEGGTVEELAALLKMNPRAMQEHLMRLKRMTAEAKAPRTIELALELLSAGRKVIVFSDHRESLHQIFTELARFGAVLIDGSTQDRDAPVQRFQNDANCRVFCGNIKAAGVGITLTAASDVIFSDFDWLPANMQQAEDRAHRIGTRGTVNIYLVADQRLLIDSLMLRILAQRSAEIASFEQSEQTFMDEVMKWVKETDAKE